MEQLERFDSTIMLPGFGQDAIPAARAVQHVIENAPKRGLHVRELVVARGQLILRGDAEPGKLKPAILDLSREVSKIVREARVGLSSIAQNPSLPRSAEES